ncbi:MAG: response regulator [Bacteroidales bacterium]|nr:response regulator [Bacteroidales bacterium]
MRRFLAFLIFWATGLSAILAYDNTEFVLIISSYSVNHPWSKSVENSFKEELKNSGCSISVTTDYLNSDRFSSPKIWEESMELILKRNMPTPPKLVVIISDEAWMAYRKVYNGQLGNVPVLLCGIKDYSITLDQFLNKDKLTFDDFTKTEDIIKNYNASGILEKMEIKKNIELMQQMLPDMESVTVITDNRFFSIYSNILIRRTAETNFPNTKFTYLDGRFITTDSLYIGLKNIPEKSAILMSSWINDAQNHSDSYEWLHKRIDFTAQNPIFILCDWGIPEKLFIGGFYASVQSYGKELVPMAVKVLEGTPVTQIPAKNNPDDRYYLNWPSMQRFNINMNLIPKDAVIYNKPLSFIEQYKSLILIVITIIAIITIALISSLLFLSRSKKLRKALSKSKEEIASSLDSQKNLSDALWSFLQEDTEKKATETVLHNILAQFNADQCRIFELNFSLMSCSCTYEVTSEYAQPQIENLQDIPIYELTWLYQKLQSNELLAIDNWENIKDGLPSSELEILKMHDIKSLLFIPMLVEKKLWGFITVDCIRETRTWSEQDLLYMQSIVQVLSMGTKHFRNEILKQESDLKFGYLYKNMSLGVCLFNKDAILSDVNEVFLRLAGVHDKGKLLGKSIFQFQSMPQDAMEKLNRGEEISFEFQLHPSKWNKFSSLTTEHTSVHYFTVHVKVLKSDLNTVSGYMMIWVDNTHLVRSQQKVAEIESLFTYTSDIANVGVSQWNPITKKGFATDQWFRNLCETTRDMSQVKGIYQYVHPEDRVDMINFLDEATIGKADSFVKSIRVWNGEQWHWLKYHATLKTFDPQNNQVEIVGMTIDIDNLKKVEESLIKARAKAEESDKLKSAFIVNMSHEIRTPLNTILGFSNILAATEDADERHKYGEIIASNNELLLGLINDIMDLSKIETGVLEFADDEVDLNNFLAGFETDDTLHVKKQVKLQFVHDPEQSCTLKIDKNRLSQVIYNYLSNAAKFTDEGFIKYGYQLQENDIRFFISDTGCGIPKNKLATIFEPFIKLNSFMQGSGLGLSICQTIIERFGGKTGVESEEGKGSTFWFTLPLTMLSRSGSIQKQEQTELPEIRHKAEQIGIQSEKPLILIAEDTQYNYMLLEVILKKYYRLLHAHDGVEAVSMYEKHKPDIILMDVKMPEMDGFEATQQIRMLSPDVPIIVISAFTFDSDIKRMYDAGCNDYVTKPVDSLKLRALISKYLSKQNH